MMEKGNPPACGAVILNKPSGMTSHDCVNKIRKLYNTKKVGHTGTLDPMATGVLVILVGRAAKAADYLVSDTKCYKAGIKLGITTDTEDISGKILTQSDKHPTYEEFEAVCAGFVGKIRQTPPMYSALKVGGQKLVNLARQGIVIEREPRWIKIDSISVENGDENNDYFLTVNCSKGTYIRTLCADIGEKLGCGAVMSSLERKRNGHFSLDASLTLEQLENMSYEERVNVLTPTDELFCDLPKVMLTPGEEQKIRNGQTVIPKDSGVLPDAGQGVRLYGTNGFFALGEVYPSAKCTVKSKKLFVL